MFLYSLLIPCMIARNDLRRRRPHEVDVHGLRVAEAVQQTEHALRHAYTNQFPFVRVIVGKGLHSAGKPILKEAITRIMDKCVSFFLERVIS